MRNYSGKLLIAAMLLAAIAAATASWWFRYEATHQAAQFWGPDAARLIRDAPQATLYNEPFASVASLAPDTAAIQGVIDKSAIDISDARGLVHLRNALLEDHSFTWPAENEVWPNPVGDIQYWWLVFADPQNGKSATVTFSHDCLQAAKLTATPNGSYHMTPVSTEPIATGLREMFNEISTKDKAAALPPDSTSPSPEAHEPPR
jgi:hypothetical protein